MTGFQDHFAPQARSYAAFRPGYPPAMIGALAAAAPKLSACWDVGTGSGQAAVMLAEHFGRVEATDASASQLAHAIPHPRVTYRVARAEAAPLADESIDLVSVAQALHWFDLPTFYAEVRRVCVPGAVVAAWSYGFPEVDHEVDAVMRWFYDDRIGQYWPPERRHVEAGYRTLDFPFPRLDIEAAPHAELLDRDRFAGFVGTWSAVARARATEDRDPMDDFMERLSVVWRDATPRRVRWPMALLAGRVTP